MPIYEYQCDACGSVFEAMQKFSDAPLTECKFCSGSVSKLISQCTFHLKGSGWYVTDYGKSGSNGNNKPKKEETQSENTVKDSASKVTTESKDAKTSTETP